MGKYCDINLIFDKIYAYKDDTKKYILSHCKIYRRLVKIDNRDVLVNK